MRLSLSYLPVLLLTATFTAAHAQDHNVQYVSDTWGWTLEKKQNTAEAEQANKKEGSTAAIDDETHKKIVGTKRDVERHIPMGPIGGYVQANSDPKNSQDLRDRDHTCPDLTVIQLEKGQPGHKAGLEIGDVIYGVNGKRFTPFDWTPTEGGKGPYRDLGLAIEDSEANRNGLVELMVHRHGGSMVVDVELPRVGGLSRTYPYNCPKSMNYYDGICDYLVMDQGANGAWNYHMSNVKRITTSLAALALLGHGDRKYRTNIRRAVDFLTNEDLVKDNGGWGSTWAMHYHGLFLSEYYLVTGDKRVLPMIEHMVKISTASMYNRMENQNGAYYGSFGHYINSDMDAQEGVYKMAVVSSGIASFWSMASQAEVDVPMNYWKGVVHYMKRCTGDNGGMGYGGPGGGQGSQPGVANAMMAFSLAPKGRRDDAHLARLTRFLKSNYAAVRENHGVCVLPFMTASIALNRTDQKTYRDYMDYWKWYLTLSRGPNNHAIYMQGYGGGAGDGAYLRHGWLMNSAVGIMMAAAKGRLFMYGAEGSQPPALSPSEFSLRLRPLASAITDKRYAYAMQKLTALKDVPTLSPADDEGIKRLIAVIEQDATTAVDDLNDLVETDNKISLARKYQDLSCLFAGVPAFDENMGAVQAMLNVSPSAPLAPSETPGSSKTPKPGAVAGMDKKLIEKLATSTESGNLPQMPMHISKTRAAIVLSKASSNGVLTFSAADKTADFQFEDLTLDDRATLTLAMSRVDRGNKGLLGVAAFYLDCAGREDEAEKYYRQAGPTIAARIRKLFE